MEAGITAWNFSNAPVGSPSIRRFDIGASTAGDESAWIRKFRETNPQIESNIFRSVEKTSIWRRSLAIVWEARHIPLWTVTTGEHGALCADALFRRPDL